MSQVSFYSADKTAILKNKRRLAKFIIALCFQEGNTLQALSIIFCSDEYLLQLNNQFLNHDYYTDILTFNLSEDENLVSEIYISVDRVEENCKVQGISFQNECCRIILHGALHLCGYNDKSASDKLLMTDKEDFYLNKFTTFHVKQN